MRFVATKTPEQQSCLMLDRTRHLFISREADVFVDHVQALVSGERPWRWQFCPSRVIQLEAHCDALADGCAP